MIATRMHRKYPRSAAAKMGRTPLLLAASGFEDCSLVLRRTHEVALLQTGGMLHEAVVLLENAAAENEEHAPHFSTQSTPVHSGKNPLPAM